MAIREAAGEETPRRHIHEPEDLPPAGTNAPSWVRRSVRPGPSPPSGTRPGSPAGAKVDGKPS